MVQQSGRPSTWRLESLTYVYAYFYAIKDKELKHFLIKIRPTLFLTDVLLVSAKGLTGDVETHDFDVSKIFRPKY